MENKDETKIWSLSSAPDVHLICLKKRNWRGWKNKRGIVYKMGSGYSGICYSLSPLHSIEAPGRLLTCRCCPISKAESNWSANIQRFLESAIKQKGYGMDLGTWNGKKKDLWTSFHLFTDKYLLDMYDTLSPVAAGETMMSRAKLFYSWSLSSRQTFQEETKRACEIDALNENNNTRVASFELTLMCLMPAIRKCAWL